MRTAAAAPASAQGAKSYNFGIAAQPLEGALVELTDETGLQLIYSSDLTRGVRTNGVRGAMTAEAALQRILAGTGLTFRVTGSGAITIDRPIAADGERVTGAVRVEGAQGSPYFGGAGVAAGVNGINRSRDITATEGTGSFTSGALTIGSKVPQALKDVPQSVSVLTSERLEQQNVTDFTTAMKQLPGITLVQGETSLENTFYSRGFAIQSLQIDGGAPLLTGTRDLGGIGFYPQIDMSIYDHVELLRGAAGTFNGYGDPGGTVNLVRKKPLDHAQFTLEAQAGSWSNYRVVADATSPLALGGKLRGRLVMTYQDNHYFYNTAKDNKTLIYGIVELDATPSTLLTAGVSYTKQDSVPWYLGLPRYFSGGDLKLPRSTSFVPPWNRWNFDTTEIFGGIEQKIGGEWLFKLNLTHNRQQSSRKLGYSTGAVNDLASPSANSAGPRLSGIYNDYSSKQFSAEASLTGAFEIFGQRQEITVGANRVNSDGGGQTAYASLISGSSATPYQPYPGGPIYCSSSTGCPAGSIRLVSPAIDVFAFDPTNMLYTEPRDPLPAYRYPKYGQIQSVGYANLRLTAFDRLHVITGLRWSRYEYKYSYESLCTSIPATGTPAANNCVGRRIGDAYDPYSQHFSETNFNWPPAVTLSFDLTKQLNAYVGYTDIYQSQASYLDGDLNPIDPITGSNWEAGLKWQARDGRLNLSLAGFSIQQKGFQALDGIRDSIVTPEEIAKGITYYFVASNGRRVPNGQPDPDHRCCYTGDPNKTYTSKGIDFEATGEILPGWQIAASYTYDRTRQVGSSLGSSDGLPYVSIQPEHNYKLWTSYDFGASDRTGWLSGLALSGGVNGQSSGFRSGSTCKPDFIVTNATTGAATCVNKIIDGQTVSGTAPYSFTVAGYAVISGRIDYRVSDTWSLAVNLENILDKTYYQTVGSGTSSGHWYGAPRSFTASLRGKW